MLFFCLSGHRLEALAGRRLLYLDAYCPLHTPYGHGLHLLRGRRCLWGLLLSMSCFCYNCYSNIFGFGLGSHHSCISGLRLESYYCSISSLGPWCLRLPIERLRLQCLSCVIGCLDLQSLHMFVL